MADLDYGKEKMDQYRRSADRVGEPQPTLEFCLGRVAQDSTAIRVSGQVHWRGDGQTDCSPLLTLIEQ